MSPGSRLRRPIRSTMFRSRHFLPVSFGPICWNRPAMAIDSINSRIGRQSFQRLRHRPLNRRTVMRACRPGKHDVPLCACGREGGWGGSQKCMCLEYGQALLNSDPSVFGKARFQLAACSKLPALWLPLPRFPMSATECEKTLWHEISGELSMSDNCPNKYEKTDGYKLWQGDPDGSFYSR